MKRLVWLLVILFALTGTAPLAWAADDKATFPLLRDLAGERELPNPFGIGVTIHYQTQDYKLTSLSTNIPGIDLSSVSSTEITSNNTAIQAKFDLWLFPFLNIFALVGHLDGDTEVSLQAPFGDVKIDYRGLLYGGGLTLAGGYKNFFATLTALYTESDLDPVSSSLRTWVVTPRVGYQYKNFSFWVGAMWQQAEQHHEGTINLPPLGDVQYNVELEAEDPWNYLAGIGYTLGKHWEMQLEGGFGNRQQVTFSFAFRF